MIRFDRRVSFDRRVGSKDADGNVQQRWQPLCALWANVRETPGREAVEAGRVTASHTATIWLRAGALARGITAGDRAVYRGLAWDILGVHPSGADGRIIELLVETEGRAP